MADTGRVTGPQDKSTLDLERGPRTVDPCLSDTYDVISMGHYLSTVVFLTNMGWRRKPFPLDWSAATLKVWQMMLNDNFAMLLSKPEELATSEHPYNSVEDGVHMFTFQGGWANPEVHRRVARLKQKLQQRRVFGIAFYFESTGVPFVDVVEAAQELLNSEQGFAHIVLVWFERENSTGSGVSMHVKPVIKEDRLLVLRHVPSKAMKFYDKLPPLDEQRIADELRLLFPDVFGGVLLSNRQHTEEPQQGQAKWRRRLEAFGQLQAEVSTGDRMQSQHFEEAEEAHEHLKVQAQERHQDLCEEEVTQQRSVEERLQKHVLERAKVTHAAPETQTREQLQEQSEEEPMQKGSTVRKLQRQLLEKAEETTEKLETRAQEQPQSEGKEEAVQQGSIEDRLQSHLFANADQVYEKPKVQAQGELQNECEKHAMQQGSTGERLESQPPENADQAYDKREAQAQEELTVESKGQAVQQGGTEDWLQSQPLEKSEEAYEKGEAQTQEELPEESKQKVVQQGINEDRLQNQSLEKAEETHEKREVQAQQGVPEESKKEAVQQGSTEHRLQTQPLERAQEELQHVSDEEDEPTWANGYFAGAGREKVRWFQASARAKSGAQNVIVPASLKFCDSGNSSRRAPSLLMMRSFLRKTDSWTFLGKLFDPVGLCSLHSRMFYAARSKDWPPTKELFFCELKHTTVPWKAIGHANYVLSMDCFENRLLCLNRDGDWCGVWIREPCHTDISWTQVCEAPSSANAVTAVKKEILVSTGRKLYRKRQLTASWEQADELDFNVVDMTATGGRLICASTEGELWSKHINENKWESFGKLPSCVLHGITVSEGSLYCAID